MTTARIGMGAQFWLANASAALTQLAEITSITLPNPEVAEVEATHFGSPNRRREYIAGLINDGEGTFAMNFDAGSATDVLIRAALNDGVARAYKIVVPDGATTWEVTGTCVVRSYQRNIPMDDRMTASLTVRFSGASTEAAGV